MSTTSACFPAESDERSGRGSLAPTPVRPFVSSPAELISLLLERHRWNGGAILFFALGLILSIGSLGAAFVSLAFAFGCVVVSMREHMESERAKAWGEAEFGRLIDQLAAKEAA